MSAALHPTNKSFGARLPGTYPKAAPPFDWTDQRKQRLEELFKQGLSWSKIALDIGCTYHQARRQGQRQGCIHPGYDHLTRRTNPHIKPASATPAAPPVDPLVAFREPTPFPPGHPITWGAITAGTLLAGAPYDR